MKLQDFSRAEGVENSPQISGLYEYLETESGYMNKMRWEVEQKIKGMTKEERKGMGQKEEDQFMEILYGVEREAEKSGFIIGFQYAVTLFKEGMLKET